VEAITRLPGTNLPEDHNSAEDNPMSADYKLPEGVAGGAVPGVVVPEVGADTWEEVLVVDEA
jgi:hypothetical protein